MVVFVIEIDIGCGILGLGRKKVLIIIIIFIFFSGYRILNVFCWWFAMIGVILVRIILFSERNGLGDRFCLIVVGINESVVLWFL